jgi:hypothetical protein
MPVRATRGGEFEGESAYGIVRQLTWIASAIVDIGGGQPGNGKHPGHWFLLGIGSSAAVGGG